ncbi:dihydrolipoamide acetyltransferase family protein [Bacteroidota bacterium]
MKNFDLVMPKLGESIQEATITKWFVKVGDTVEEDDVLLEIATDKVDSEIPSPVEGKISEILFKEEDVVEVGAIIAKISLEGDGEIKEEDTTSEEKAQEKEKTKVDVKKESEGEVETKEEKAPETTVIADKAKFEDADINQINSISERFYSPLVKSIAKEEKISVEELESIKGTGKDGRVKKEDILNYLRQREKGAAPSTVERPAMKVRPSISAEDHIVEMDRLRKLTADHMVMSVHTSPHVTSVVEADVTNLVLWRNKVRNEFFERYGQKLTYMPVFIEATAKALRDFPQVNASVDGFNIIYKKAINIGVAVAIPNWNLVVPVIKNADQKNIAGLTTEMNALAKAARESKLKIDDIQGGTFTITNFGTFKNIIGTPIINQPQVAILATGSIEKKPAIVETPQGDTIGIRHKVYLSLSYDHRVVDGALGGAFLKKIADYLEDFDINTKI